MDSTYTKRRAPAAGSRGKRGNKNALTPKEKRRLIQLAVSIGLFLLVFLGRGIFPAQLSQWQQTLAQDTDFPAAFSAFGQAISEGAPVLDTLEDLWIEVFAGGRVTEENGTGEETDSGTNDGTVVDTMWQQAPAFSQRLAKQLLQPEDMICAWYQGQLAEPAPAASEEAAAEEATASPAQTATVQSGAETETAATAAAPDTETKTIMLGGETLTIQSALRAEPEVVTAVAQAYTEDGQALPASVSMQFYTLGLETTVTPVSATLTSDYGYRDHPVSGSYAFHRGVDLGAPTGTPILAFSSGTVEYTGESEESGLYLQIDHGNGVKTFYAHCSQLLVSGGETVQAGETVALVGETGNATGPHLHFALTKDGIYLDPLFYIEVN